MLDVLFWWSGFGLWLSIVLGGICWLAVDASDRRVRDRTRLTLHPSATGGGSRR